MKKAKMTMLPSPKGQAGTSKGGRMKKATKTKLPSPAVQMVVSNFVKLAPNVRALVRLESQQVELERTIEECSVFELFAKAAQEAASVAVFWEAFKTVERMVKNNFKGFAELFEARETVKHKGKFNIPKCMRLAGSVPRRALLNGVSLTDEKRKLRGISNLRTVTNRVMAKSGVAERKACVDFHLKELRRYAFQSEPENLDVFEFALELAKEALLYEVETDGLAYREGKENMQRKKEIAKGGVVRVLRPLFEKDEGPQWTFEAVLSENAHETPNRRSVLKGI